MKPANAKEMDVAHDLSGYAMYKAYDMIFNALDIKYGDIKRFVLKVPSQSFAGAVGLAQVMECTLEIDFSYKEDEWSFTGEVYKEEYKEHTVWSPGA